jgi:hypothetical protein
MEPVLADAQFVDVFMMESDHADAPSPVKPVKKRRKPMTALILPSKDSIFTPLKPAPPKEKQEVCETEENLANVQMEPTPFDERLLSYLDLSLQKMSQQFLNELKIEMDGLCSFDLHVDQFLDTVSAEIRAIIGESRFHSDELQSKSIAQSIRSSFTEFLRLSAPPDSCPTFPIEHSIAWIEEANREFIACLKESHVSLAQTRGLTNRRQRSATRRRAIVPNVSDMETYEKVMIELSSFFTERRSILQSRRGVFRESQIRALSEDSLLSSPADTWSDLRCFCKEMTNQNRSAPLRNLQASAEKLREILVSAHEALDFRLGEAARLAKSARQTPVPTDRLIMSTTFEGLSQSGIDM